MAQKTGSPFAFLQDLALGGTSGVIAKTACAPLERVKILLQVGQSNVGAPQYNGMMDALVRVRREQGVLALWRGNLSNCMRYFPTQAMNFAFKEKYQKLFVRPKEEVGFARWFAGFLAAGGAAGATALTVSYPLEFTYTRLAADTGSAHGAPAAVGSGAQRQRQYTGLVDCLQKTVKSDGIRGIYRGYGPSVAGIIVYRAGYFGLYDFSKVYVMPLLNIGQGEHAHSYGAMATKFGLALTIDIFSAVVAYPLDTVRRNMMMMSGRADKTYTTSLGCFKHIMATGGVQLLYKGVFANSVRAIGSALVLVIYDELKHFFLPDAKSSGH
jgi:solute carrier family 25 (adenine nucleotide translocator) protein 4/5/6/31